MTKQEAIEKLREFCKLRAFCELYPDACQKDDCEIYMAIEALSCSEKPNDSDLISRQEAITEICDVRCGEYKVECESYNNRNYISNCDYIRSLLNLPSAQPEHEYTMEEFMFGQDMGNPEDGSL